MKAAGAPAPRQRGPRDGERGAAAIAGLLFMMVMLGFLALSFNTGILMETRTELQTASDSAALAAAGSLDGTLDGVAAARDVAVLYGEQHRAFDEDIVVDSADDVSFGRWHLRAADCKYGGSGTDCFQSLTPSAANASKINAVRVDNGRDDLSNSVLDLHFAAYVGQQKATVRSGAVAVGPGVGAPGCSMPLVLAECKIRDGAGDLLCGDSSSQLVFSNANQDAVGYVNLDPADSASPSGTWVADYITSKRMCHEPTVGQGKLHNGNDFGKVADALRGTGGGECLIGKVHNVAVVGCDEGSSGGGTPGGGDDKGKGKGKGTGGGSDNGGGASDTSTVFQGEKDIIGFVQARIVAVTDNKGTVKGCGDEQPAVDATPEKNSVVLEILCEPPEGTPGGIKFGPGPNRVRIVK